MNKWLFQLITLVVTVLSPALRKSLETLLTDLEESASKTANPWDDMFVDLLKTLLLGN